MFGRGVKAVTVDELEEKLAEGKPVLIDVREPYEFADGHIARAVSVPLLQLAEKLRQLDRDAETYVICQHGRRSVKAVRVLSRAGFKHVYGVEGGIAAWRGRLVRVRAAELLGAASK